MKLGQYSVQFNAHLLQSGRYTGTAVLTWDEGNATCEKFWHFHKEFATEGEAKAHARVQAELLHRDGKL